jgi:HSP20 family molecular chaperone IbpA
MSKEMTGLKKLFPLDIYEDVKHTRPQSMSRFWKNQIGINDVCTKPESKVINDDDVYYALDIDFPELTNKRIQVDLVAGVVHIDGMKTMNQLHVKTLNNLLERIKKNMSLYKVKALIPDEEICKEGVLIIRARNTLLP